MFSKNKLPAGIIKYKDAELTILPLYLYHEYKPVRNTHDLVNLLVRNGFYPGDIIKFSNRLVEYLKHYQYINADFRNMVERVQKYKSAKLKKKEIKKFSPEYLLEFIDSLKYSEKDKSIFENFLESSLIQLAIESLTYGKNIIGGFWSKMNISSKRHVIDVQNSQFYKHMQSKNDTLEYLSKKISPYPPELKEKLEIQNIYSFNENHSRYSVFLEYLITRLKYYVLLQNLTIRFYSLQLFEKEAFDMALNKAENALKTFIDE
jgi:hypothetical protein